MNKNKIMKLYIKGKLVAEVEDDNVILEKETPGFKSETIRQCFLKTYYENHKYCPKCGNEEHWVTLRGYINPVDIELYKDNNLCTCCHCGDEHTTHERLGDCDYFISEDQY